MSNKIHLGVSGILVNSRGKILLGRRSADDDAYPNHFCTPGGGVEFGEPLEQALEREFLEETGLDVNTGELVCIVESFRPDHHTVMPFYRVNLNVQSAAYALDGFSVVERWGREEIKARWKELTPLTRMAMKLFLNISDTNHI